MLTTHAGDGMVTHLAAGLHAIQIASARTTQTEKAPVAIYADHAFASTDLIEPRNAVSIIRTSRNTL